MELIDKAALVAEIENRIKESESMKPKFDQFWAGQISAFKGILKVLDTLKIKEVDSEKEVQNIIHKRFHDFYGIVNSATGEYITVNDLVTIAKYFFKLGLMQKGEQVMDYEKKYKEALERARKCLDEKRDSCFVRPDVIFPELQESEDEKIKKCFDRILQSLNEIKKSQ